MRFLEPHEYTQQAGRAGRRGYDTKGYVIHLTNLFDTPDIQQYKRILSDRPQTLRSKFCFSYHLVLNTIKNSELKFISTSSLMNKEIQGELTQQQKELDDLNKRITNYENNNIYRTDKTILDEYINLVETLPMTSNKQRKKNSRLIENIKIENHFIEDDYKRYKNKLELLSEKNTTEKYLENTENYVDNQFNAIYDLLNEIELTYDLDGKRMISDKAELVLMIKEANSLTLLELMQKTNYFDSNTFSPTKGLIIAGDHSVYGSIEGAVLSGVNASKKILN